MKNKQKQTKQSVVSTSKRKRRRKPRGESEEKRINGGGNYSAVQKPSRRKGKLSLNAPQSGAQFSVNSVWETKMASTPGGMRLKGREYGGTLFGSNPSGGTNIAYWTAPVPVSVPANTIQPVHPRVFARLEPLTDIYEFYKFHNFRFIGNSLLPTTATGNVTLAIEPQYSDCISTEVTGATNAAVLALPSAVSTNIYADFVVNYTPDWARGKNLRFSTDCTVTTTSYALSDQECQAGIRSVYNSVTATGTYTTHILQFEYDIEFYGPKYGVNGVGRLAKQRSLRSAEKTVVPEPDSKLGSKGAVTVNTEGVSKTKDTTSCPHEHSSEKAEISTDRKGLDTKVDGSLSKCTCVPGKDQLCYNCYLELRYNLTVTPTPT